MPTEAQVAGGLVFALVALYVRSLHADDNRKRPRRHTLLVIGGSLVVVPYVLLTSPAWYSLPMQITVSTLILVLDWFSFHEDKTRFSEEDLCATGPCRRNAMITGHLAHWGDVLGLASLLMLNTERENWPVIVAGFATYGVLGSQFIHRMTEDGSVSDMRGRTDEDKCKNARIMRDSWRGGLNDLITVLGILAVWQALYVCGDGRCQGATAPWKVVRSVATDAFADADTRREKAYSSMRLLFTVLASVVPTYGNYINTAAQHGQLGAERYKLPPCFDDE